MSAYPSAYFRSFTVGCVLALIAILTPSSLRAQCEPLTNPSPAKTPEQNSSIGKPEFFDEPAFTVAGVVDTTNLGGHASGMAQPKATEALAKGIVSLGKEPAPNATSSAEALLSATEKSLRDAADSEPANFEANRRVGKFLADDGKPRAAIPYLERAAQLDPRDYKAGYELARAYAETGDYQRARSQARALLAQPDNDSHQKAVQDEAAKDKPELHHLLGEVEEKLGNPLEAVRQYQRAAELEPSESNLFDWGAELLLHRAPEPAIEVFGKGNRLFPHSVRMLVGLGVAWSVRGSYEEATRRLCAATDLNPSDPTGYLFLGKMLGPESADSQGVVERLGRWVRLQPENALANYYYALGLWKLRKTSQDSANLAQVESLLEKAVRLDPTLGAGYLQLGIVHAERDEFRKAITAYEKAIAATPKLAEAHYRLSQAYRRVGDEPSAQKELQTFRQVSKESEDNRERREIQQFVYKMQNSAPRQ